MGINERKSKIVRGAAFPGTFTEKRYRDKKGPTSLWYRKQAPTKINLQELTVCEKSCTT